MAEEWWANDALATPPKTAAPRAEPSVEAEWWKADPVKTAPDTGEQRTWTGHPAPTNVKEGVQQIGRDIMEAGRRVGGALESAGKTSHDLLTGELPPTPENVLPAVAATLMPAQRGTAAAIASVAGRRGAAPAAQTAEMGLPRYLQSEGQLAAAEKLGGIPFVGKPVREAAAKPLAEFEGQVAAADKAGLEHYGQAEAAALRPTGAAPDVTRAGEILAEGAKAERAFVSPRGAVTELGEQRTTLPPKFEAMIRSQGRPENNVGRVIAMAGAGEGRAADFKGLAELRKNINSTDWRHVEGAAFTKLGEVPVEGGSGVIRTVEFDPITALRNYEALPEAGRRILFGRPDAPFRSHLNSLAADTKKLDALSDTLAAQSTRLDPLRRIPQKSTTTGIIEAGAMGASALVHPMAALAAVVGGRVAASMLARPQTAAALALWSKAYVRFFQSGGGPAGLAALKLATNNLQNISGEDIDPEKLVAAMQGSKGTPIRELKVRKTEEIPNLGGTDPGSLSPYWGQDLGGIHQTTTRLAPRGIPWESMRRSQNVETGRQPPFNPPGAFLDAPEQQHDWAVKNIPGYQEQTDRFARENARERAAWGPPGPLSRAAGLADLEMQSRRPQVPSYESVITSGRGPFEAAPKQKSKEKKR